MIAAMNRPPKSPLLTIAKAAEMLKLNRHTLEHMRRQDTGPPFRKHGGRVFYRDREVKAWSENGRQRAAGALTMRMQPLLGILAGVALVIAPCLPKHPLLIWNASPSVPIGLYRVAQGSLRLGDLVLVRLAGPMAMLAHRRGYLPRTAYLLKPISAVTGDRVCRFGHHIIVPRRPAALALRNDSLGRPMPTWLGCRTLQAPEIFLFAEHAASFDSRYFGPLRTEHLVGRAVPLWTRR